MYITIFILHLGVDHVCIHCPSAVVPWFERMPMPIETQSFQLSQFGPETPNIIIISQVQCQFLMCVDQKWNVIKHEKQVVQDSISQQILVTKFVLVYT